MDQFALPEGPSRPEEEGWEPVCPGEPGQPSLKEKFPTDLGGNFEESTYFAHQTLRSDIHYEYMVKYGVL